MNGRWSAPWLDSRLDAVRADPVTAFAMALAERIQVVDLLVEEAFLYGVTSRRQQLRDEGWSGWLLDLDAPVRVAPAGVRAPKGEKRRRR
ncbi:hypothetical protein [Kitasatospora mediocidica]|uniref:hypothetical protein n=1 Tax=Kitasatospora mediocidica TaxID=58352 RepID=UPI00056AAD09|nr:hypothetical protein [Kitasatospora mediocidica]